MKERILGVDLAHLDRDDLEVFAQETRSLIVGKWMVSRFEHQ
jgi:hypothetical protein